MKHRMDDDFVVCEYIDKGNYLTSIVLGQFRDRELVYKGHMTLGVSGEAFAVIKAQPQRPELLFAQPSPASHGKENAVWLEPELVCVVAFMHRTKSGGMRQPVFKGLRLDKLPLDCAEASENQ
jgi:ATP-dependent DNA ligase